MVALSWLYLLERLWELIWIYGVTDSCPIFVGFYVRLHIEFYLRIQNFNPRLHNCFVTPCLSLRSDLNSLIPLPFSLYLFISNHLSRKIRRDGNVLPSAKWLIGRWTFFEAWWRTSYPNFISTGFFIRCYVIHDKRQKTKDKWFLIHVCQIRESSSFSLP